MKKIVVTGFIIVIALFCVTCDAFLPEDEVVAWRDWEASEDGMAITVYLDGSNPVPVTRAAQRAMTTGLSKMAYDYLEVVFHAGASPADTLARASWDLGQSAGISGVYRGADADGVDYLWSSTAAPAAKAGVALMAVGKKNGKTLLGIGRILQVDRQPPITVDLYVDDSGGILPAGAVTPKGTILEKTKSVTFWIESIKTGLAIKDEAVTWDATTGKLKEYDATTNPKGPAVKIAYDSFIDFAVSTASVPLSAGDAADRTKNLRLGASRNAFGRMNYPLYPLDEKYESKAIATYVFGGAAKTFVKNLCFSGYDKPLVEKRFPRYLDGGNYREPPAAADTDSTVIIASSYTDLALTAAITVPATITSDAGLPTVTPVAFKNEIPLEFESKGYGIFSFYIEIPVYLYRWTETFTDTSDDKKSYTVNKSSNSGPDSIPWKIRTGLGSELYSLDDGLSSGGCILMGVGVSALDWLDIEWNWVK